MGNLITIRRRIKSAKNISQITKAMEMVSASKMKKAQETALMSRPFTDKLRVMISNVAGSGTAGSHPLTTVNPHPQKIAIVMISTNKGLCGALNVNLHKGLIDFSKELGNNVKIDLIAVGTKARTTIPYRETTLQATFKELSETPSFEETRAVSSYLLRSFSNGEYDQIFIAYPKFISTLKSEITLETLLPITLEVESASAQTDASSGAVIPTGEYQVEPNPKELLESLLPYSVEMAVYQSILEARASEHSARMVAMKNASDNARDLISGLTLMYNQARQSQVTSELLDVTTARMALE